MKNYISILLVLLMSMFLVFGCADSSSSDSAAGIVDDGTTDGGTTDGDNTSSEITKIHLGTSKVLVVRPQSSAIGKMLSTTGETESPLFTVQGKEKIDIEIDGGSGKTLLDVYPVKNAIDIKAAIPFKDEDGNITTCFVDQEDNCIEVSVDPQKTGKFLNSDRLIKIGSKIYTRTAGGAIRTIDLSAATGKLLSTAGDATADIIEDVDQYEITTSGDIMYESNSEVILRRNDGVEEYVDGSAWGGNNSFQADASLSSFFLARETDRSFMFYGGGGANIFFLNIYYNGSDDPVVSHAQPVAYAAYLAGQNGVYTNIPTNKSPSVCSRLIVGSKNLMICQNEVFELGSDTVDLKKIDFVWAGHESPSDYSLVRSTASSNYLYYYDHSDFNGVRLTWIDLENNQCRHLFSSANSTNCVALSSTLYTISQLTVTSDDTINFCGQKQSDSTDYIVQITGADTSSPTISETPGECSSIISF